MVDLRQVHRVPARQHPAAETARRRPGAGRRRLHRGRLPVATSRAPWSSASPPRARRTSGTWSARRRMPRWPPPRPGATCESVDAAARKVITDAGFGPGYKVPGLPHRTGHGIGLDGHEWTYLVRGNKTPLQPGHVLQRRAHDRHLRRVRHPPGRLHVHHRRRRAHVHQAEPGHRSAVRIDHMPQATEATPETYSSACAQAAGGHEGVRPAGHRARARARHDVPHRRALGKERAHLRRGPAGERRPGLGAAGLRRDARARADPRRRRHPRLAGGREPLRADRRDSEGPRRCRWAVGIDDGVRFFVFDGIRNDSRRQHPSWSTSVLNLP